MKGGCEREERSKLSRGEAVGLKRACEKLTKERKRARVTKSERVTGRESNRERKSNR